MLAGNDESHRVLSRALAEQDDGYRRWMRPADIIEQSTLNLPPKKPMRVAEALQRLFRRIRDA